MAEIDYTIDPGPTPKGYENLGEVPVVVNGEIKGCSESHAWFTMAWCDADWVKDNVPVSCNVSCGAGMGSSKIVFNISRGKQHDHFNVDVRDLIGPIVEMAMKRMEAERIVKNLCPDCGGGHEGECAEYSIPATIPEEEKEMSPWLANGPIDDEDDDVEMTMEEVGAMIDTFDDDEEDDPDPDWMTITLPYDVHARVVSGVVQLSREYDATVLFRHDGEQYSWDSFFGVMQRLATKEKGDEIEVGTLGAEKHVARALVLQVLTQDAELQQRGPRGSDSPFAPDSLQG